MYIYNNNNDDDDNDNNDKKHINNDHNIYIYTHVKFKVVNSLGLYKLVYRTPQKDRNIIYHNSGRMLLFYLCWHLL